MQDIRIRYKRTVLGPLWITVSMSVTFICIGSLFSAILKNDVRVFLPYLAAGMVIWSFISAVAAEGPQVFVDAHHIINSLRIPLVVHVLRCVARNALIFFHNSLAALMALLILGGSLTKAGLLLLVSLPILFAIAFFGGLILAILGARFRDLGPIVGMVMQLTFFMTPIMWRPEDIADGSKWWVAINPAYHLIQIVRAPMLGSVPAGISIAVSLGTATALGLAAYALFRLFRHRITYWL